jgi:hypothetical protein
MPHIIMNATDLPKTFECTGCKTTLDLKHYRHCINGKNPDRALIVCYSCDEINIIDTEGTISLLTFSQAIRFISPTDLATLVDALVKNSRVRN